MVRFKKFDREVKDKKEKVNIPSKYDIDRRVSLPIVSIKD